MVFDEGTYMVIDPDCHFSTVVGPMRHHAINKH